MAAAALAAAALCAGGCATTVGRDGRIVWGVHAGSVERDELGRTVAVTPAEPLQAAIAQTAHAAVGLIPEPWSTLAVGALGALGLGGAGGAALRASRLRGREEGWDEHAREAPTRGEP